MGKKRLGYTLTLGLALLASPSIDAVGSESFQIPIRTANMQVSQLDPNAGVRAIPLSPTPLPPEPAPVTGPLPPPPPPVPDPQPTTGSGGAMYRRPLGSDYQRPETPKKEFLGDPGGFGSHRTPLNTAPLDPTRLGVPTQPGLNGLPMPTTDRIGIAPPPGTLGQTYHRRSRLIDDDKHPRMAAVDVHLSDNYDVSGKGLKAKWTGKVWHLSTDTLLPGIPHIYEIVAEWGPENAKKREVRTVRLIMNRVVDLEF